MLQIFNKGPVLANLITLQLPVDNVLKAFPLSVTPYRILFTLWGRWTGGWRRLLKTQQTWEHIQKLVVIGYYGRIGYQKKPRWTCCTFLPFCRLVYMAPIILGISTQSMCLIDDCRSMYCIDYAFVLSMFWMEEEYKHKQYNVSNSPTINGGPKVRTLPPVHTSAMILLHGGNISCDPPARWKETSIRTSTFQYL